MWNNGSAPPFAPGNTPHFETFDGQTSCLLWHLQNKTVFQGYAAAQEACSVYENTEEMGTATAVISWLLGLLIVTCNAAVILGIIRTTQLHKPLYIYMANLAVSDLVGGVGLLYRTVDRIELMRMHSMMNIVTFLMYSQVVSASALSLLSVNSYVAVRHHVFFHNHAGTAKRDAGIAIVSSWLVLSLFVFLPSMGWNCLDVNTTNCLLFYHTVFVALVATLAIVLVITMLFTNISTFVALKQRQKKRFEAQLPDRDQGNNQGQNGQHQPSNIANIETERKHKRSVQKARTVLVYVVVAFIFWLLPLVLIPICLTRENGCPALDGPHARAALITVNSAINPIASIIRTPDLRRGIWQTVMDIRRALVTRIRGNPANPQGQQQPAAPGDAPNLPLGTARDTVTGTGPNIPAGHNSPVNIPGLITAGHSNSPANTPAGQLTAGHSNSPANTPAGQLTAGHSNSPANTPAG
ncbi:Gamma-tubulin complex component 5 [Branchiostoma belcheri]|nr:Gamma-tubulin complex component 5 [Branchiostoma belcheri]